MLMNSRFDWGLRGLDEGVIKTMTLRLSLRVFLAPKHCQMAFSMYWPLFLCHVCYIHLHLHSLFNHL